MSSRSGDGTQKPARGRGPTLHDVAAAASVDASTVSKVLSGAKITVRPDTRARIEAAVSELNYRPNVAARGLRLARTGAFGMFIPDFANPAYATIVRGAVREAEARGRVILLAELDESHTPDAYLRLVHERRIDGLLVATARDYSPLLSLLRDNEVPHVFINRQGNAGSLSVSEDDEMGAAIGTQALIDAGHVHLGLINGPEDIDTARRRQAGFDRACRAAGIASVATVSGPYTVRGGYEAAKDLLDRAGARPTGVLVATLTMALGTLAAFAEANLRVPRDISVVGFDDGDMAQVSQPPLTCVAMPHNEMGAAAVELLESVVNGDPVHSLMISTTPRLVSRHSVAPPGR